MIIRIALSFSILFLLASSLPATAMSKTSDLAITDVTVVDVISGRERRHRTVLIRGDRIAEIRPSSTDSRLPETAMRIGGRGLWLIPGLWDMHIHALTDSRFRYFFPLLLANGVTSVRDMASNLPPQEVVQIRRDLDTGRMVGPRLARLTFRILDGAGTRFGRVAELIPNGEAARAAVTRLKLEGADFAKPYNLLSRQSYLALSEEARRRGVSVEGHLPFAVSAFEAASLAHHSFEHNFGVILSLSRDEQSLRQLLIQGKETWGRTEAKAATAWDEEKAQHLFAQMRRNGVWSCPTISFYCVPILVGRSTAWTGQDRYQYVPQLTFEDWTNAIDREMSRNLTISELRQHHFATMQRVVREMHQAGVPILAGTDSGATGAVAGFSLHDELGELVAAGMRPVDALRSATILPARFTNQQRLSGSIDRGKLADLVLVDADPLADIGNTRKIRAIIRSGHFFDRKALDRLLDQALRAARTAPKPAELADD